MKEKTKKFDCGAIVARFQTHELHEAHKDLIQSVLDRHERVMIFLGICPIKNTLNNPLEFKHRKAMIEEVFPKVEVYDIEDKQDDGDWSKNLDKQIQKWLNPTQSIALYGSRDSFLKHYQGKFPTIELESELFVSATETRKQIINFYPPTKDFRAGLIAATGLRYPTAYQTVDVAIINDENEILLVKKPNEPKYRFLGGFSDPNSNSLEEDVKRESQEEAGVEVGDIKYIGSAKVNDWRYRGEKDCIKTAFFVAKYIFGKPEGADDVELVKWFKISELNVDNIMPNHVILLEKLNNYLKTK